MKFFGGLLLIYLFSFSSYGQQANDGSLDLSDKPVGRYGLNGNWEFYWNELLTPEQLLQKTPTAWMKVPGIWHRNGDYPVRGFATYRVHVRLNTAWTDQLLYFPTINTAATIWINGQLVARSGEVGKSEEEAKARLGSIFFTVPDHTDTLDIVVQVSNFNYYLGGIDGLPEISSTPILMTALTQRNGAENLFAGSLIAMFVFQIILFSLFHQGKPHLWIALICLGVAFRTLTTHGSSFLLPNFFPSLSWEFWKKLEFGSVYLITALFPLYVYDLFLGYASRRIMYVFVTISALLLLLVVFTPQYVYGSALEVAHVSLLMGFIFALVTISKAWITGNRDARIILFGVLTCFPFIALEILRNSSFIQMNIPNMYLVEVGVIVFLLFQVYLLAHHQATLFEALEKVNVNLEQAVQQRTQDLVKTNEVKERLLSVMSHDVRSPINSLRSMLQIYNSGAVSEEEFKKLSMQIEEDLNKTGIMVENILYWTANQLKGVVIKLEKIEVTSLIDENIKLFSSMAINKGISLNYPNDRTIEAKIDRNILHLVIRNLLSNAIKFSYSGGKVIVTSEMRGKSLHIEVRDQGTGIDSATMESIFSTQGPLSQSGTGHEKGAGLGLALSREYLLKAGGSLSAESAPNEGTVFKIEWPQ